MTPSDIAGKLTPAQWEALAFLASRKANGFYDSYNCGFDGRAASALVRKNLAEKENTKFPCYRATDLGRAVAKELEGG